ncbi:hypothetical protein BOX15_Mlig000722g3 [Macrostomum lignano]|uniref:phosphoethanolamine N-methyltransferase n=1 Tax=Macrostomum lignano TaxID=282301 RepID=A0A267DMG2_9PLAT|nr:hypothetical protein BOX15_Mlig000722g3 [Macrostomum lignano]
MQNFIDKNRELNGHHGNVEFGVADVTKLNLSQNRFDFIFSNWLFMYLDDSEVAGSSGKSLIGCIQMATSSSASPASTSPAQWPGLTTPRATGRPSSTMSFCLRPRLAKAASSACCTPGRAGPTSATSKTATRCAGWCRRSRRLRTRSGVSANPSAYSRRRASASWRKSSVRASCPTVASQARASCATSLA